MDNTRKIYPTVTVIMDNFCGRTGEKFLENIDDTVKINSGCLIVHAWSKNLTNRTDSLNQAKKKKIVKLLKMYCKILKLHFSALLSVKQKKY